MDGIKRRRVLAATVMDALRGGRVSVLAVVAALLLCHGAFGYAHQLPATEAHAAPTAHAAGGHHSVPDGGTDGAHQGGAYFATLLALLFGTALLLGDRGRAYTKLPVPAVPRRGHGITVPHPPRGPTLPSLQVFRL